MKELRLDKMAECNMLAIVPINNRDNANLYKHWKPKEEKLHWTSSNCHRFSIRPFRLDIEQQNTYNSRRLWTPNVNLPELIDPLA